MMIRTVQLLLVVLATRVSRPRDEQGDGAVPWLVVIGFGVAIAIFAGDSVMDFAKGLVGQLGGK